MEPARVVEELRAGRAVEPLGGEHERDVGRARRRAARAARGRRRPTSCTRPGSRGRSGRATTSSTTRSASGSLSIATIAGKDMREGYVEGPLVRFRVARRCVRITARRENGAAMHESDARADAPDVVVRAITCEDTGWLARVGLDPEKVGRQYHWAETPLQLYIAPARAVLGLRTGGDRRARRASRRLRRAEPAVGQPRVLPPAVGTRARASGARRSRCSSATTARRIANGDS